MRSAILTILALGCLNVSASNYERYDEYRPDFLTRITEATISFISESCSTLVTATRNASYGEKINEALKAGRLKLVKENLGYEPAAQLFGEVKKNYRTAEKYSFDRLQKIFKGTDKLYAMDGLIVRHRPGDDTAFVIPRELEKPLVLSRVINEDDVAAARATWVDENFFPRHELLKKYSRIFSGPRSTWVVNRNSVTYEVEVDGQKPNDKKPYQFDRVVGFKFKFRFFADGRSTVSMGLRLRESEEGQATLKLELAKYFVNKLRFDADELEELWETFLTGTPFEFQTDEDLAMMLEKLNKQLNNGRLNFEIVI